MCLMPPRAEDALTARGVAAVPLQQHADCSDRAYSGRPKSSTAVNSQHKQAYREVGSKHTNNCFQFE